MATKRKKTTKKAAPRRRRPLSGLGNFETARINQKSIVNDFAKPVAIGVLGAAAGHFAGKGKNLALALAGGFGAIALGYGPQAMPAIIGCAVVTPPSATATAGIDGLDGLKDFVAGGTNRSKGYVKSLLTNVGMQALADKIPVSGIAGLAGSDDVQDIYDQGYIAGMGDVAALEDGSDDTDVNGLRGTYLLAQPGATTRSIAAALAMP